MGIDNILPGELALWQAVLIVLTSFAGAALTAATSIGGGVILIAVMSALMPAPAVVPVHGGVMIGSNIGRTALLLSHVDWHIVGWFLIGGIIGGLLGAPIAGVLPAWGLRLAVAGFILFTQWGPKLKGHRVGPGGYVLAGAISNFLTLFVGASGPFMTTLIAMVKTVRQDLVATAGACMSLQHSIKVIVFAATGFIFAPWLPLIAICIAAGFIGSWLGTKLLGKVDEARFRVILKWLLTGLAILLIYMALTGFRFTG